MEHKFAIFDMDGTLTDSMGFWNQLAEEYITSLGFQYSSQVMDATAHLTVLDSAALFVQHYGLPKTPEQVAADMNALMEQHYRTDVPLKPGAGSVLARLQAAGWRMCVASSTSPHLLDICLRRLGLRDFFQFLISAEEVGAGKDRPDVYLEAARRMGSRPENTVVFEDVIFAARTAKAAGFTVAAIYDESSKHDQEELQKTADYYLTRWDDPGLLSWLGI